MEPNPKYQRLGGWLLFFFITYCLGCISVLGQCAQVANAGLPWLWALPFLVWFALRIVVIAQILGYKKSFLAWFIIEGVYSILVAMWIAARFNTLSSSPVYGNILATLIVYTIWIFYFSSSERCEEYFAPVASESLPAPQPQQKRSASPAASAPSAERRKTSPSVSSPAPLPPPASVTLDLPALSLLFQQEAEAFEHDHLQWRSENGRLLRDPVNVLYAAYTFFAVALPLNDTETGRRLLGLAPDPPAALSYIDSFVDAYNAAQDAPKESLLSNPLYSLARAAQLLMGGYPDAALNADIAATFPECVEKAAPLVRAAAPEKPPLHRCMSCGAIIPDGDTHCAACRKRLQLDQPLAPAYTAPIPQDEAAEARAQLRYCKYCGLEMGKDVMVCPSCGKRARWFRKPTPTVILSVCLALSLIANLAFGIALAAHPNAVRETLTDVNRASIDLVNRYAAANGMSVRDYIQMAQEQLEGAAAPATGASSAVVYYTEKGLEYHSDRECPRLLDDGPYVIYSADGSTAPGLVKTPNAYKKACPVCIK